MLFTFILNLTRKDFNKDIQILFINFSYTAFAIYIQFCIYILLFHCLVELFLFIRFNKFYNTIQKSVVAFSHTIDMLDAALTENINVQQSKMTDWIIEALFLLCDMDGSHDIEERFKSFSESFGSIVSTNETISEYIMEYVYNWQIKCDLIYWYTSGGPTDLAWLTMTKIRNWKHRSTGLEMEFKFLVYSYNFLLFFNIYLILVYQST